MRILLILTNHVLEFADDNFVELVRLMTPHMALVVDGLNFVAFFPIFIVSKCLRVADVRWHLVKEAAKVEISIIDLVQSI